MGNADTLLSTNFVNAVIIGVSGLAVSTLSYVPMFNSLKVLFMKLGFGMSFNCLTSVEIRKKDQRPKTYLTDNLRIGRGSAVFFYGSQCTIRCQFEDQ